MGFDLFGQPDEVLFAWGRETPSKRQGKEKLKEMKRHVGQNTSFFLQLKDKLAKIKGSAES